MAWTYPKPAPKLYLPASPEKGTGEAVFQLAHQYPEREVLWYLNGQLLGTTIDRHDMPIKTPAGHFRLLVVDERGEELAMEFYVASQ